MIDPKLPELGHLPDNYSSWDQYVEAVKTETGITIDLSSTTRNSDGHLQSSVILLPEQYDPHRNSGLFSK